MNLFTFIIWGFFCFGVGYMMRRNVAASPEHKELLSDIENKALGLIGDGKQEKIDQLKRHRDAL